MLKKMLKKRRCKKKAQGGQTGDGEEEEDVDRHLMRCQGDGAIGHCLGLGLGLGFRIGV